MDDITRLFGLRFCMLVGCYVAGAIPLALTMSEVRDHSLYCVHLLNEAVMSVKIQPGAVHVCIVNHMLAVFDVSQLKSTPIVYFVSCLNRLFNFVHHLRSKRFCEVVCKAPFSGSTTPTPSSFHSMLTPIIDF